MTKKNEQSALRRQATDLIDDQINRLLAEVDGVPPLLERMARFHLGLTTQTGQPVPTEDQQRIQGKRMRPLLAMLACTAAGGNMADAAPLGAAIELLHNFTLIHDDIQDRSPRRRHRPTVWAIWGEAQAINAGDALFAAAHIGVLDSRSPHLSADHLLVIARAFNRMTIDIVRGQVLDLGFEGRGDVSPEDYLTRIRGKTAAIVQFAAWAGALLGGAELPTARLYAAFGESLGLGFQIRDDALGVWGAPDETGKETGDDIRRRKQSLPILLLREAATPEDREALGAMFGGDRVAEDDVVAVLSMLRAYGIEDLVEAQVRHHHDEAIATLDTLAPTADQRGLEALRALTDRMSARST